MPRFRYHDEKSAAEGALFLAIGAAAGLAAGVIIAQKYGGFSALTARVRSLLSTNGQEEEEGHRQYHGDAYHDEEEHSLLSPLEELEERVLETYHNDPVLSERAIDIGAIDEGIVELTGWVGSIGEAEHAVVVARGTPGVRTVVNRLIVRADANSVPLKERWTGVDEAYSEDNLDESEPGPPRGD